MKTPKQDTQVTHSSPIGDTFFARFMGFWIQQKLLMVYDTCWNRSLRVDGGPF